MNCPRCHLEFRSVILRKVLKRGWADDKTWREVLECGHHRTFAMPTDRLSLDSRYTWAYRRACPECLAAHHKEIGVG